MENESRISGDGNIVVQNVHGARIDITQYLGRSVDYRDLADRENKLASWLAGVPLDNEKMRLEIGGELEHVRRQIRAFERDILNLAEAFQSIPINTEQLRLARKLFEEGKFREADAILAVDGMRDDQDRLLADKERSRQRLDAVNEKLRNNSNEFLIKARITALNFESPTRFEDACGYFEDSIRSYAYVDNVFGYAYFLHEHRQYHRAITWYQKLLDEPLEGFCIHTRGRVLNNFGSLLTSMHQPAQALPKFTEALEIGRQSAEANEDMHLPGVALTLDNLAGVHSDLNDQEAALSAYNEALAIRRRLAAENPRKYLRAVANTLHNLGIFYLDLADKDAALAASTEALEILRGLASEDSQRYLPDFAGTMNSLGRIRRALGDHAASLLLFAEALEIRRNLATMNPQKYLRDVAATLNSLGVLRRSLGEFDAASTLYGEALRIWRQLAQTNSEVYLPDVVMTLSNLGFVQNEGNEKAAALATYTEVLALQRQLAAVNRQMFEPDVAKTFYNLGNIQHDLNDLDAAIASFTESLQIRRTLVGKNPEKYVEDAVRTLLQLSFIHYLDRPDRGLSTDYAHEAMGLLGMVGDAPYAAKYSESASQILKAWESRAQ